MNKTKIQTLKGFRDFLPKEAVKRQYVINKLRETFELFGFEPLETPALEYEELLMGKYGEEGDRLMYRFEDNGGRRVALRYDQTVPLARVVSQYGDKLPKPFKRYQIQPVWRAENTQKGRYREFLQCDIDIVGSGGLLADVEVITCVLITMAGLGFKNAKMLINDRSVFNKLKPEFIVAIDKLKKIGSDGVISEIIKKGGEPEWTKKFISSFNNTNPTPTYLSIKKHLESRGFKEKKDFEFEPTLARGLDYYTSTIFELVCDDYTSGSLGGGGRYDNLIENLFGENTPAVGYAFGFDRVLEAMKVLKLPIESIGTNVLVTVFSQKLLVESYKVIEKIRDKKINSEIYISSSGFVGLDKQLKYADKKGIPSVIIIGPDEAEKGTVILKDMKAKAQKEVTLEEAILLLKNTSNE